MASILEIGKSVIDGNHSMSGLMRLHKVKKKCLQSHISHLRRKHGFNIPYIKRNKPRMKVVVRNLFPVEGPPQKYHKKLVKCYHDARFNATDTRGHNVTKSATKSVPAENQKTLDEVNREIGRGAIDIVEEKDNISFMRAFNLEEFADGPDEGDDVAEVNGGTIMPKTATSHVVDIDRATRDAVKHVNYYRNRLAEWVNGMDVDDIQSVKGLKASCEHLLKAIDNLGILDKAKAYFTSYPNIEED